MYMICSQSRFKYLTLNNGLFVQVDAVDATGLVIPISVWVKRLNSDEGPRCLVVMEPVERTTANVTFDSTVSNTKYQCDHFPFSHYCHLIVLFGQFYSFIFLNLIPISLKCRG